MMRTKKVIINPVFFVLVLVITCASSANQVIYVDDDASGLNDGSSWQNAYTFLQDALVDANSAEKHTLSLSNGPVEIRVAQGTYKPDRGSEQISGDRKATFKLLNDVTIKGGYAGLSEPDQNLRDIDFYETVLSGDLNDDDVPEGLIFDDIGQLLPSYSDNSKCVIKSISIDRTAVLDGFTITGGYFFPSVVNGRGGTSPIDSGGGMLNISSSPTVINCTFERNRYAVENNTGSNPVFIGCRFLQNIAGEGGAIMNIESNLEISSCVFENNGAWNGGAICLRGEGAAILTGCTFLANQARQSGGAIYNDGGNIKLTNCEFNYNRVEKSIVQGPGGAIFVSGESTTVLERCSFIRNETPSGGGGLYANDGTVVLFMCEFRRNSAYTAGGLFIGDNVVTSINNCTFESNVANLGSAVFTVLKIEEDLTLNRCILVGNRSLNTGSAVLGSRRGSLQLIHCTLDGNLDNQGTSVADFDSVIVRNSIIWDQRAFHVDDRPYINIAFSDIRNSWLDQSQGNIDVDPLFADPGYWADVNDINVIVEPNDPNAVWIDGDYHLKSQAGRWDPNSGSWVIDDVTSLCIDAGDPNSPIGDEPFPNGGIINMGAFGGTTEASKSYFGEPLCETIIAGDINGDCKVDLKDFMLLANHWLKDK